METKEIKSVAIIMDGNGRYAKERNKPVSFGHLEGTKNIIQIARRANRLGVKVLTLFAFSTENWKRSDTEVNYLMSLPKLFFNDYIDELMSENIKVQLIGERDRIPMNALGPIESAETKTANNTGMILNLCFNYGGQREIILAVKDIIDANVKSEDVTEELFASYLSGASCNPVDLVIRTSGEQRISNFLLWEIAYSELFFVDKYWPDFTGDDLEEIITSFSKRERRFGGR